MLQALSEMSSVVILCSRWKLMKEVILVRRSRGLGDVLLATGLLKRLRKENPHSHIVFYTAAHIADAVRFNLNVDEVAEDIDMVKYDRFVDLDLAYEMDPKTSIWEAYAKKMFGDTKVDPRPELFSIKADYASLKTKIEFDPDRVRVVVCHTGANWPSRVWPKHYWIEAINNLTAKGFNVAIVDRSNDFNLNGNRIHNLVNKLSIFEIRELLKRSAAFAGSDSGVLHIAQTTDIPIVGIFTVANPKLRLIDRPSRTIALVPKLACRFCLHRGKPPVVSLCCSHLKQPNVCLFDIKPRDLVNAVLDCMTPKAAQIKIRPSG
jgi:ADP-heptose:LPS heptosyltransferase